MSNSKPIETCNPLLNHLIIECLMKHVKQHRKQLRLVSSTWNRVLTNKHLVKECTLVLDEQNKVEEYLKLRQESTLPIPQFENAEIKINSCLSHYYNGDSIIQQLWEFHLESLRCLKLEITTLYAQKNLKNLLLHHLHNLQELKVTITEFWSEVKDDEQLNPLQTETLSEEIIYPNRNFTKFSHVDLTSLQQNLVSNEFQFPINFMQFFQRYPNVKVLSFVGLSNKNMDDFVNCLQNLQKLRVNLKLEKLEILDENMCPSTPSNDHIQSLSEIAECHLQNLQELHIELTHHLQESLLSRFLQKMQKSLIVLKLRRFPLSNLVPLHFNNLMIIFPSLTFLEVSDELFSSLNFILTSFPSLTTLHIILRDYSQLCPTVILQNTATTDDENNLQPPHLNLRNLWIEQPLWNENCVTRIFQLFPNLANLKARMDNDMVQELCRIGSQSLQQLHIISWDGLTDQGFTGIGDNLLKNVGGMDNCLEGYRNGPYIGNLKSLKELTCEIWPDDSNHVSDASIYFGFLDLPLLKVFNGIRTRITTCATKRFPSSTTCYLED